MENYYTVEVVLIRYTIVAPNEYIAAEQATLKFLNDVPHYQFSTVTAIVNGKKIDVHVEKTFKVSASVV